MNKIYRQAACIVIPLAVAAAFIEPVKLPLGVVAGAVLALINFRGMMNNLSRLMGTENPTARLVILSALRLFVMFAAIVVLAALKVVNLLGLMVGFTVVVVLVVRAGYVESQSEPPEDQQ